MIAKVFRSADTEETGSVDASVVPSLAVKALGSVRESDTHLIRYRAEAKAGMVYTLHCVQFTICLCVVFQRRGAYLVC